MKLKKFWIPTLLLGIIGAAAKLGDTFFSRGNSKFILGHDACNGIFIASIILMLLTGWVMLIAVRKAKVTAQPTKNIPAGFLGFIASVAVLGGGVISMLSIGAETNRTENLISCICGICGGIVMLYCACISAYSASLRMIAAVGVSMVPSVRISRMLSIITFRAAVSRIVRGVPAAFMKPPPSRDSSRFHAS